MEIQEITDIKADAEYWVTLVDDDLHCFSDAEQVKQIIIGLHGQGLIQKYELPDRKGIMVFAVTPDFRGGLSLNEVFMYIKPEYRGNIRLFKQLIDYVETYARVHNIPSVRLASNIGYDDDKVLRVLQHWGYKTDAVVKYMR